jgi:hypothetical protein
MGRLAGPENPPRRNACALARTVQNRFSIWKTVRILARAKERSDSLDYDLAEWPTAIGDQQRSEFSGRANKADPKQIRVFLVN